MGMVRQEIADRAIVRLDPEVAADHEPLVGQLALGVPTVGLASTDHRHPDWRTWRPTVASARFTSSSLDSPSTRSSSGLSKLLAWRLLTIRTQG